VLYADRIALLLCSRHAHLADGDSFPPLRGMEGARQRRGRPARSVANRDRQCARFREMFEALAAGAGHERPELPPLWPPAAQFIVHGVNEMVADRVRADRSDDLPGLLEDSVFLVALVLADEATARRVA
jgi:hypothetical protein